MGRDYILKPETQSIRSDLEEWLYRKGAIVGFAMINPNVAFAAVFHD